MSSKDTAHAVWRKSARSNGSGDCVEVADLGSAVGVRDSKNPTGPALEFSHGEFQAFIRSVKAGTFDLA